MSSAVPTTDEAGRVVGWQRAPAARERMVPLVSRFILPHTRILGGIDVYGVIPDVERPAISGTLDAGSEVRRVIRRAMA